MSNKLLTPKFLLVGLGLLALISIIIISYNAAQTSKTVSPSTTVTKVFQSAPMNPSVQDKPVNGQIIVKFKSQYTNAQINEHLKKYNASIIKKIESINQTIVKVSAGKENAIEQQLKTDPYVEDVQRDYTTHAFFTPNDEGYNQQYGLNNTGQSIVGKIGTPKADIRAESAWDVTRGDGIKVAILDTGIDLNQPDLAGKVAAQKSFISSTVDDQNGHGTHVAGIIAADTNNGIGVAGTCPNCQLIIGKIIDDSGEGTTSNAIAGITWAADQGAKVINLSVGTTETKTASLYNQAAAYAIQKGALIVAAVGNDNSNQFIYPAAATQVLSVGATDNNDKKASWSNYGNTWVDIAAPGENILSTGPTHSFAKQPSGYTASLPYFYLSGTSMAGPEVAGVAALVASTSYGTTPTAIAQRILATADKVSDTGTAWAYGRINAANAVGASASATTTPPIGDISPTIYCVGGAGTSPCATIPPTEPVANPTDNGTNPTSSAETSTTPSDSETITPTVAPTTAPNGNNPGTGQPCATISQSIYNAASSYGSSDTNTLSRHKSHKKHNRSNQNNGPGGDSGWLSEFFQFLIQLIEKLLQLIGIGNPCLIPQPAGTPNTPNNPGTGGNPGQNQNPIAIPTTDPNASSSPTLAGGPFGNSCTPGQLYCNEHIITGGQDAILYRCQPNGQPPTIEKNCKDTNLACKLDQSGGNDACGVEPNTNPGASNSGTPGNNTPGNNTPGNNTPGNNTPGNNTPGNNTPGNNTPGNNTPGNNTPGNNTPGNNTPGSNSGNPYSPDVQNPDGTKGACSDSQKTEGYSYCNGDGVNSGYCLPPAGSCFAPTVKGSNGSYCVDETHQAYKVPANGQASATNRGTCQVCPKGGSVQSGGGSGGSTSCTCDDATNVISKTEKTCVQQIDLCTEYTDNDTCTKCIGDATPSQDGTSCELPTPPSNGTGAAPGATCDTIHNYQCAGNYTCEPDKGTTAGHCKPSKGNPTCGGKDGLTFGLCPSGEICQDSVRGYSCVPQVTCGGSDGLTFGSCLSGQTCTDSVRGYTCVTTAPPQPPAPACIGGLFHSCTENPDNCCPGYHCSSKGNPFGVAYCGLGGK